MTRRGGGSSRNAGGIQADIPSLAKSFQWDDEDDEDDKVHRQGLTEPQNPGRAALLGEITAHEGTEMEPKHDEM